MSATENVRVFVVNDHPDIVRVFVSVLGDMGFRVRGFADPLEFLEAAKQEGCDIAVVNARMPELNGVQVIEALRKMDACMLIILETGLLILPLIVDALRAGADDMLPLCRREEFEATVKRAHQRWEARVRSDAPFVDCAQATPGPKGQAEPRQTPRDQIIIYAVNDDPSMIEAVRLLLEEWGYTSFWGFHEPDAIVEAAADEPCHIALVNLGMPRSEDGIGVVRALRAISPWTHIILDTCSPDCDTISEAAHAGINDVLHAPFRAEELPEAIERACLRLGIAPTPPLV